jgi:hypothetical protein
MRKEPMAMLLVYGARKEVTMEIIGEYLNPLAEVVDGSEENFLGLAEAKFNEAEVTIGDVTTRARSGDKIKAGINGVLLIWNLGSVNNEDEDSQFLSATSDVDIIYNFFYSLQCT